MQDAKEWRWQPSLVFGIKPNRKPGRVTKLDVLLADALRMYEDSLCAGCGVPAMWAWDLRFARYFVLDTEAPLCNVCALRETPLEGGDQPDPGEKLRVLNNMFDDEEAT